MISTIIGSTTSPPSTTAVNYNTINPAGTGSWATTEPGRAGVVPHSITLDNLIVTLSVAPALGKNRVFEVMKNGVASGLNVTISDTALTGTSVGSITLSAGDTISLRTTPTGTPTASGTVYWSLRQDSTSKYAVIGINLGLPTAAATNYQSLLTRSLISATENLISQIVPTAGTFTNLYIRAGSAFTGSQAYTFLKNGVAQSVTATLTNPAAGGQATDTINSVSVIAGDVVSLQIVTTGTPVSTPVSHAITFTPTVDGESFLSNSLVATASATAVQHNQVLGSDTAWIVNEVPRIILVDAMTVTGMYATAGVAPGAGKSITATLRAAGADTAATVTMTSLATGSITGLSISLPAASDLAIRSTPTGTPTTTTVKTGVLVYFAPTPPAGAGIYSNLTMMGV